MTSVGDLLGTLIHTEASLTYRIFNAGAEWKCLDFSLNLEPSLTHCVDLYFMLQVTTDFCSFLKFPSKKFPLGALLKAIWKTAGYGIVIRGHVATPKYKRSWCSCAPLSSLGSFSWRCRAAFLLLMTPANSPPEDSRGWICSVRSFGTDSKLGMLFTEVFCDSAGRAEGHLPVNSSKI